jgi:serine/threonine protein kinase
MFVTTQLRFERRADVSIQGANSTVFFAYDPQLRAELVVKQVPKAGISDPDEYFAEASLLYDARHPNVVDVKYACADADHIYLAMPRYKGSLQGVLQQRFLTVREIVQIGLDFLAGLHHVHTKRLIHFDIKPSNVLLDEAGRAAISDFGLTRFVNTHGLATPDALYDKNFPPEYMTLSNALSTAADVYQAGLTLYRMCNGVEDFESQFVAHGSNWQDAIIDGKFPDRKRFLYHIPNRLRRLIGQALSIDPDARFPTILDLTNELARVDEHLDWEFSPMKPGGAKWELRDEDSVWRVRLSPNGTTWDIKASRTRVDTGKESRLPRYSVAGIQASDLASNVQKTLTALE